MKKSTNLTFTLLLGAFVFVGLSACAEGNGGEGADTTAVGDTSMTSDRGGPMGNEGSMSQDSVSLQSTNQLLQGSLTAGAIQPAVQNIEGWEQKLGNLNLSGQAQQAASNITDALGQLRDALQANGGPDMAQVTQSLNQVNQGMQTLSQNAQSLNLSDQQLQRFQRLQQTLSQLPQQLGGGGGM